MNTRYSFQPDLFCNSSTAVPFLLNPSVGEDRTAGGSWTRSPRAVASSLLIRTAIRVSRSRWFAFLRRVFHYQNGSRSDIGSNPFNSRTWMMLEFLALVIHISLTTFTLAVSKQERPVWPMWIVGYDIGCALSLLLLYGRYRHLHVTQGDGFGLPDVEQQRTTNEESRCTHLMNNCKNLTQLKKLHCQITKQGLSHHPSTITNLIYTCTSMATFDSLVYAKHIFNQFKQDNQNGPTLFMFNSLIRGYSSIGLGNEAIVVYLEMLTLGISPDKYTFPFLLSACTKILARAEGFQVHGSVIKLGFQGDVFVLNSLIHFYAECREIALGRKVFDEMTDINVVFMFDTVQIVNLFSC